LLLVLVASGMFAERLELAQSASLIALTRTLASADHDRKRRPE
jgi:hypothetical protein